MEFTKGDAVKIESGQYGFASFAAMGVVVFRDWYTEKRFLRLARKVSRCIGCECGNPFSLCHPDA